MRTLLQSVSPQLVNAADSFSDRVFFVPVSSVGWDCKPDTTNEASASYSIKPEMIAPLWVTVPFLLAMRLTSRQLL